MSNIQNFAKGSIIAKADHASSPEMFVIMSGSVGVYLNYSLATQKLAGVLSAGGYYGEKNLFLSQPREHSLVALSDAAVLIVNKRTLGAFLAQTELAASVISGICGKLLEAEKAVALYNLQNSDQQISSASSLFPEGHGKYTLPINNASDMLYEDKINCPVCAHPFSTMKVITSRLKTESTDKDLRTRYKDFEPLYYDVTSCPKCFYSATGTYFEEATKRLMPKVNSVVAPYQLDLYINAGVQRDTFTVFTGFYLAILCADCFDNPKLVSAGLWLKLSRLYDDCGDKNMYMYASQKALEDYLYSYKNYRIDGKQMQNMRFVIADLYLRVGEVHLSREFFFMVKSDKSAPPLLARRADERLEETRELVKNMK